jgi:hypothetical protein
VSITEQFNKSTLIERVKSILLKPGDTWGVIAGEPATVRELYSSYAIILAAIPPVAGLIGRQVFGVGLFGVTYHPPFIGAVVGAIFSYVLSLIAIYILSLIINALAPSFDGQKSHIQAMKVAVYSYTASWVAGIFQLVPALSLLALLGSLYSLYLLYVGLPKVMGAPQAKALGYTVVCIISAIVLYIIIGVIVAALGFGAMTAAGGGRLTSSSGSGSSGVMHVGGATIDLDKLQAASKQLEAAGKQMAARSGDTSDAGDRSDTPPVTPIAADVLKGYLPDSIAGYMRGEVSATSGGVAGISGSNVEAQYAKGDAHMTLTITDLGAAGGFAALAGALGVEANKETATGYEKVGKVDGRMTTEEWDRQSKNGKYGVLVANRFMIEAEGNGGDIGDLKDAVTKVGPDKLEGLAKK